MTRPTSIRVGPYDVRIIKMAASVGAHGEFDDTDMTIAVKDEYSSPPYEVDTWLHELLHAIWFTQNIKDGDGEERTVRQMATGLTQVFRDNPDLLRWLLGRLA